MAVEFVTKDAAALKTLQGMYENAKDFKGKRWAVFGQVYLQPENIMADSVLVRAVLIAPFWAEQINRVMKRMIANQARAAKRKSKARKRK